MAFGAEAFQRHAAAVRARLALAGVVRPGPGSVTWKINREVVVITAWGRAILLQLAHPAIAAGVDDHSRFRGSLRSGLRRGRSTIRAMLSITFGDDEQMVAAAAAINSMHDRVRGHVGERAGATYSAHDPDLQRWVHATLVESMPLVYERLVGPLTSGERDQYCAEQAAIVEPLLGLPAGWLPRRSADLDDYLRDMHAGGRLVVTDRNRALARAVLYPPRWYWAWPAFRATQLLTIGSLPPSIRAAFGFDWRARDERAFARWTTFIRRLRHVLPPMAREWPAARQIVQGDGRAR